MSLLSRIFSPTKQKAYAGTPAQGLLPTLGASPSAAGTMVSQATSMTVSAVHRAVTTRAADVARCTPRVVEDMPDGSQETVTDHPLARLFRRPNEEQTWLEFIEEMEGQRLLRGNAYAAIIRDSRGTPVKLIPINADAVMVLEGTNGLVFYNVNRIGLWQLDQLRDLPVCIPSEDVLHVRGLTFNALVGASRIGLGRDSIGLAMALEQQAARWLQNGARPSVLLKSAKTLSDVAVKRLKAAWDSLKAGIQNTGETVILEEGMEAQVLSLSSVDLQFIEQRRLAVADVARFFKFPLWKLEDSEAARGLDYIKAQQQYVNEAIAPALDRWERRLEFTFGLNDEGLSVVLDPGNLLRADATTRYNNARLAVLSGLISPNEFRISERMKPVPGGDAVRAPVNLAALGSDMTGTAPDGAGRPSGQNLPNDGVPT